MSVCRLVAGLVGLVLAAVVVTVVVAVGSEVRAELAPAVAKDEPVSAPPAFSTGCLQAPRPVVIAARLWNRCSPFALASSVPQGTTPFLQA